jgi:hypothetical protein
MKLMTTDPNISIQTREPRNFPPPTWMETFESIKDTAANQPDAGLIENDYGTMFADVNTGTIFMCLPQSVVGDVVELAIRICLPDSNIEVGKWVQHVKVLRSVQQVEVAATAPGRSIAPGHWYEVHGD